jgi:V8-like Glu-specific endopeptidase
MQKETARQFVKVPYLLKFFTSIAAIMLLSPHAMGEVSIPGEWALTADNPKLTSEPPMWKVMRKTAPEPMAMIDRAEFSAPEKLDEIRDWNRQQRFPTRNGISHELENPAHIAFDPGTSYLESGPKPVQGDRYGQSIETADGDLLWSASVVVDGSYRLRLQLENVTLPDGVQMWVHSDGDEHVGPFGAELLDDKGTLWTPSVAGPELTLVVLIPGENATADFTIIRIAELFKLGLAGDPLPGQVQESDLSCMEDAVCVTDSTFDSVDGVGTSMAHLHVMNEGNSYACSGGLIKDTVEDSDRPFFLTANHCISTQSMASSLEAYWDYKSSYCGGPDPSHNNVPRTNGATLLVTGTGSDFSLLELNSVPGGRWFMGWNANESAVKAGTRLHRLAYSEGSGQKYAQTEVDGAIQWCSGLSSSLYIIQSQNIGAVGPGNSGAPVLLDNGQIVGQLRGPCGQNLDDDCDYVNFVLDGALHAYWSDVQPFLSPGGSSSADLALTFLDAENGTHSAGDEIDISFIVENIGGVASDNYRAIFYISNNTTISTSDYVFGHIDLETVEAGAKDEYSVFGPIPDEIPGGSYYVGAILTVADANPSNNTGYDSTRITIQDASSFQINPGLNGSWYDPDTNGQGFLIDVLPKNGTVFLAWFTYETVRPPTSYSAILGEPGHRWLTAQGGFSGDTAQLNIVMSAGGVFDKGSPTPSNSAYGTITLEFRGCNSGTITYSIPGIASNKVIQIERVVTDNVGLCETLNQQMQTNASSNLAGDESRLMKPLQQ